MGTTGNATETRAPDLLFEHEQRHRVEELGDTLNRPELLRPDAAFHRITVFLTYRCNLDCPYCKTIARTETERERSPQKRRVHDLESFEALLASYGGAPVRHLHFTGGEAALVPDLPSMARSARRRGVEALSLTSNGTLAPDRYLALLEAGLTELRISLDANEAALGATLTGRRGAFDATVRTLDALALAKGAGARFTLIINSVIGLENRARLPQLVRFFLRFRPDDVKLITEVDRRDELAVFPRLDAVRAEVEALLDALPEEAMPLLRRKLKTVFSPTAIGLPPGAAPVGQGWRCYIPLTERTVDRVAYYPCSVYLREGGAPLGLLTDPPELQRRRSIAFVRDADCRSDPICTRYCLHCTRSFNDRANGARR